MMFFSVFVIVVSSTTLVVGTLPDLRPRTGLPNESDVQLVYLNDSPPAAEKCPPPPQPMSSVPPELEPDLGLGLTGLLLMNVTNIAVKALGIAALVDDSPHWLFGCRGMLDGDVEAFVFIEFVCIIWFTFEFVARLVAAPSRRAFLFEPMNIIDLLSILPFYFTLFVVRPPSGPVRCVRSIPSELN